jgi:alpha-tubulin suppressor-like RCC1 family protein
MNQRHISAGCKNVLLIDETINGAYVFVSSVNSDTCPIIYNKNISRTQIRETINRLGNNIERIGIAFELVASEQSFIESAPFFKITDIYNKIPPSGTATEYSENLTFLLSVIRECNIKRIDFLACDTISTLEWAKYYDILTRETGVIVGASNDKTGNIKNGGDWVMETTNQDIELIYFTKSIKYYEYVLGAPTSNIMSITDTGDLIVSGGNNDGEFGLGPNNFLSLTDRSGYLCRSDDRVFGRGNNTFVLTYNGSVYVTGQNTYGELGTGDTNSRNVFTLITVPVGKTVKDIACGVQHTIMLMTDGTVYATGYNAYGQLCLGNSTDCHTLTQITALDGKTPKFIACGGEYTFMIMTDGTLYSCGRNNYGQLGLGDNSDRDTLVEIPWMGVVASDAPKSIACGIAHTVICTFSRTTTGFSYVTGRNSDGQLGTGDTNNCNTFTQVVPDGKQTERIFCGDTHTIMFTKEDRMIYATGSNANGELGLGDTDNRSTLTQIVLLDYKVPKTVSCGSNYTFITMLDGTLYAFGANAYGQLGLGDTNSRNAPTQVTVPGGKTPQVIACGGSHAITLTTTGSFYVSGRNAYGQLGMGNTIDCNTLTATYAYIARAPAQYVRTGYRHTVFVMVDGNVYVTGTNYAGQLGLGDTTDRNTPTLLPIPLGKTVQSIECGSLHTIILMTDGSVYGTGQNSSGELGQGNWTGNYNVLTSIPIPHGKAVETIHCGSSHTTFRMTDGTVFGTGSVGLGLGESISIINVLTEIHFPNGKTAIKIFTGSLSRCTFALMTDGTVYATGFNGNGELGLGDLGDRSSFTLLPLPPGKSVETIAFGGAHTLILMTDGSVYGTGNGGHDQFGLNNKNNYNILTELTLPIGKTAKNIFCGYDSSIIVMTDETLYGAGYGGYGGFGSGSVEWNVFTGITIPGGKTIQNILASYHTIMSMTDGSVYVAGWNADGQLGIGNTADSYMFTTPALPPAIPPPPVAKYFRNTFTSGNDETSTFLIQNGKLYATGKNTQGQLGLGYSTYSSSYYYDEFQEVPIPDGKTPDKVLCCMSFTLVVMTDGSVYGTGSNYSGALGLGDSYGLNSLTLITVPDGKTIQDIAIGFFFMMMVMTDGSVYGCGSNGLGSLGTGDRTNRTVLTQIPTPGGKLAQKVFCGLYTTILVMTDNTCYGVGYTPQFGMTGELGESRIINYVQISVPGGKIPDSIAFEEGSSIWSMTDGTFYIASSNFTQLTSGVIGGKTPQIIACGGYNSSILTTDGSIYVKGYNTNGQLGLGDTVDRYTFTHLTIPDGKTPLDIVRGFNDFIVTMTDGTAYAAGYNRGGILGYTVSLFPSVSHNPVKVPSARLYNKTPLRISRGEIFSYVLMTDGTMYSAGVDYYGNLGLGYVSGNISSFTQISVPDGKTPKDVACGAQHAIVLMTDGTIYGTGFNMGQLGLNDQVGRNTLTHISVPDGKTVKNIACGRIHTIIITTDGYLYGTGFNDSGQLGLDDIAPTGNDSLFYLVFTRINVYDEKIPISVNCGDYHTIVQMADGTVYGTGTNDYGQLGQGNNTNAYRKLTLIPLPSGKRCKTIMTGKFHTIISMTDGSIYACGQNTNYQLGLNTTPSYENSLSPMVLPEGKIINSVTAGSYRTTVSMTDGSVYYTGNSESGGAPETKLTQIRSFNNIAYLADSVQNIWADGIDQPYALAAYGSYIYVGRHGSGVGIDRYNLSDGTLDTVSWVNGGTSGLTPISMAVDSRNLATPYLYAVGADTSSSGHTPIFKISLSNASIISSDWAPAVTLVSNIAIYGDYMYTVDVSDGIIRKLSLADGSIVAARFASVSVESTLGGVIMNIDDTGTYMYVQRGSGIISKIVLADGMIVNTSWINIYSDSPPKYWLDGFIVHGPSIYATNTENGKIVQIRLASKAITNASWAASTGWITGTSRITAMTVFGSSLYIARSDTGTIDKFALPAITNICFPATAPVETDQGIVSIARIDPAFHTIQGVRIIDITKTVTNDTFLIRINKGALGENYPTQDTEISRLHKIQYNGKMIESEWFVGRVNGVEQVPYFGDLLYNVVLEEPLTMRVNNLVCETLLPSNPIAKLYARSSRYSDYTRDVLLSLLKHHLERKNHEAYRKLLTVI